MDPREHLQGMLSNFINGDESAAADSVHQYLVAKARELAQKPAEHSIDDED